MVDARKQFAAGNIDDAEKMAYKPSNIRAVRRLRFRRSAQKLLEECQRAKQARGPTARPTRLPRRRTRRLRRPAAGGRARAIDQNADKNRAIVMVAKRANWNARACCSKRVTPLRGRNYKAAFTPDEDSPITSF